MLPKMHFTTFQCCRNVFANFMCFTDSITDIPIQYVSEGNFPCLMVTYS